MSDKYILLAMPNLWKLLTFRWKSFNIVSEGNTLFG